VTVTANYTMIDDCEGTPNPWTLSPCYGDPYTYAMATNGSYEPKQGTDCYNFYATSGQPLWNSMYFTLPSTIDITQNDFLIWIYIVKGKGGNQYLANGEATRIRLYDSTALPTSASGRWGEWSFGGDQERMGNWEVLLCSGDEDDVFMQGETVDAGIAGVTTASSGIFTEAGQNFLTTVSVGDTLILDRPSVDEGHYTITSVDSNTQVTCSGANFTGATAIYWRIVDETATVDYTDIKYIVIRFDFLAANTSSYPFGMDYLRYGKSITVTGGTVGSPLDITDIEDAVGYNTQHGIVYFDDQDILNEALVKFTCGVNFGDDSTSTYFTETGKVFYISQYSDDVKYDWIVKGNAQVTLGQKVTAGGENFAANSVPLIVTSGKNPDFTVRGSGSKFYCYGSVFKNWYNIELGLSGNQAGDVELLEVEISDCNQVECRSSSLAIDKSKIHDSSGSYGMRFYVAPSNTFTDCKIYNNTFGINLNEGITVSLKEFLFTGNTSYDIYFTHSSGTATINLIDSTDNVTASQLFTATWNIYEKTTYNLNVKDELGSNINQATVRLENDGGSQEFCVQTDSGGDIAEQQVVRRTRTYTGSLSTTVHNPFQLRVRKYDYIPQQIEGKTFGETAISDAFVLLDDDVATTAVGTVSGWSSDITINETPTPDRIELSTTNHSLKEVFEYMRYYTALVANMDLIDPIESVDGVTFYIYDYDFQVDTVELTGSTLILLMSTKDFTTVSGGSQSLKKLTDVDGTQVLIKIHVEDSDGNDIENAQTAVYKVSDDSQLMNEDTDVNGDASESFLHTADTSIYYRVRKSSTGSTRYIPFEGIGTITSDGFSTTVILYEDTNVE